MPIQVPITWANVDPDAAPLTLQQLVDILKTLTTAQLAEEITPYIVGSSTPGVDDQDKVWHRKDSSGRPLGTYVYYGGFWVREAPPIGGRYDYFSGDPATYFDGTGKGISGPGPVALDYYGWALANGQNGTADLSDRFLAMATMNNLAVGYSSGSWKTGMTGAPLQVGGATEVTLTDAQIFRSATEAIQATHYTADGNARDSTGKIWGSPVGSEGSPFDVVPADPGNETPDAVNIVNPFFALALIAWVGYP